MGEERKVYRVLVGKPEGKRPLGRPRRRWEDGIRMELVIVLCILTSFFLAYSRREKFRMA
jgi:hypothetical protein